MTTVSIAAWVGIALGVAVTVLAYVRFEEMGRLTGAGAGIIIGCVVLLSGISGTMLGVALSLGAGALVLASMYAALRDVRKRGRRGAGKSS